MRPRLIFITGTDTGVGKTLLTSMLLCDSRGKVHTLAMKPFCCGSRADVELLHKLQDHDLSQARINPFYFPEPIAPLVAARRHRRLIRLREVIQKINFVAARLVSAGERRRLTASKDPPCLLIEGIGGLLVPLGEAYTVLDLIAALDCQTIVVSPNRLGTINHTLLTVATLQATGIQSISVVFMNTDPASGSDPSTQSNGRILSEMLGAVPVIEVPFLGKNALEIGSLKKNVRKIKKTLARIMA